MARINKQGNKARAVPTKASKKMDVLIKDANPAPPSALLLFLPALASDLALQFCLAAQAQVSKTRSPWSRSDFQEKEAFAHIPPGSGTSATASAAL